MTKEKDQKVPFLIGKIAGIALVAAGFFHFLIGDKIFRGTKWSDKYSLGMRILQVSLTIIVFGIGLYFLIYWLINLI